MLWPASGGIVVSAISRPLRTRPSEISVSAAWVELVREATSPEPTAGVVNVLTTGQQVTSASVKPIRFPYSVSWNGPALAGPAFGSGAKR
jgi:hypothetical protein